MDSPFQSTISICAIFLCFIPREPAPPAPHKKNPAFGLHFIMNYPVHMEGAYFICMAFLQALIIRTARETSLSRIIQGPCWAGRHKQEQEEQKRRLLHSQPVKGPPSGRLAGTTPHTPAWPALEKAYKAAFQARRSLSQSQAREGTKEGGEPNNGSGARP